MRITFICLFILFFVASCQQKCPCSRANLPIGLVSFTTTESDTVIIRRFEKNSNFHTLKDSLLVDKTNCEYDMQGKDTVFLSVEDSSGTVNTSFDYEIYIPAINRLTRLNSITENYVDGLCGRCINPITSYEKDGQAYTSIPLFIVK